MKRRALSGLIDEITEKINESGEREEIFAYIKEVAERGAELCRKGEHARALTEYKFMFENLKKEFSL